MTHRVTVALFTAILMAGSLAPAADTSAINEWGAKGVEGDTRSPADWVDPLIDTHKSRWIYFSSACRPFGMVNLSPDTRTGGDWMCGYLYGDTKVRCFSHIHDWQLYGVAVMPVTGEMRGPQGMDSYASDFSHNDEKVSAGYHKVILKDNQPSTAMAHLFNLAGAPALSQKWVREVKQRAFGDITPFGGYNGDEDQGQMGALGVLMAIGLFDVTGGVTSNATYQVAAPLFDRVTIHLNPSYFPGRRFSIVARNHSPGNIYIQSARLDGQPLNRYWFPHSTLARGAELELNLGPKPSNWAKDCDSPK